LPLDSEERAVLRAIEATRDPDAARVVQLAQRQLDATTSPYARRLILAPFEQALEDRLANTVPLSTVLAVLAALARNSISALTAATAWKTFSAALPTPAAWMAAGYAAKEMDQGNWRGIAMALSTLAPLLPTLRNQAQLEALIQALPIAIRGSLETLHAWLRDTDTAANGCVPDLGIREVGPALAVAALLWYMQSRLPAPPAAVRGLNSFIAELPFVWKLLTGGNQVAGALFTPVLDPDGPDISAPRQRLSPEQKQALVDHKRAVDRRAVIVPDWQDVEMQLAAWDVPGRPKHGGPVAADPVAVDVPPPEATATSPAASPQAGMSAWFAAAATLLNAWRGLEPVAQEAHELMERGTPADTEPLMSPASLATAAGAGGRELVGVSRRHPRTALAAVAATTVAAAGGVGWAARGIHDYLWPGEAPDSMDEVVERAAQHIVRGPGGEWMSELGRLEATLAKESAPDLDATSRAPRVRRDLPSGATSTAAPAPAQASLPEQIHVMRLWSLAVAQDIAQQPGWEWVAQAPASEQELLVTYWQALRQEQARLVGLETIPGTLLAAGLKAHGWQQDWQGIEVRLPSTQRAGVGVDDRLPLLEYCLARSDYAGPAPAFLRDGVPVDATELAQLRRFVASNDCRTLREKVGAEVEHLRPALEAAVKATLVIHALRAKAGGTLGSGDAQPLRGADIVLGFLQGAQDVESSPLTYVDRLADGTEVSIVVSNYLVLRSASTDPALHGQVVLYRSDLSTFQTFGDESRFRQFLDTHRAKPGLFVDNHRVDQTLADDIVRAAPPAQQAAVRDRVQAWESRLAVFQSRPGHPDAWNPRDSVQLHFTAGTGALEQWAARLVRYRQRLEQQRLDQGALRWSPLGIANAAAEADVQQRLNEDLQSLNQHAAPAVTDAIRRALRMAGFRGSLEGVDPDRILLGHGGQQMSLTAWASNGWQRLGLHRPALAFDPDAAPRMPNVRLAADPWPSADALASMTVTVEPSGEGVSPRAAAALTDALQDEALRRAICGVLEDFADSNRLADAYSEHLQALLGSSRGEDSAAGTRLVKAMGNQIRLRTAWMIEKARTDGAIDAARHAALVRAQAYIDPASGTQRSSLMGVTVAGKPITGLWAMQAGGVTSVFLPDTANGDLLLSADAFNAWVAQGDDAERYIRMRTLYRHHPALAEAFSRKETEAGIPVGFSTTGGPDDAARRLIEGRISDVDELTLTQLERFGETLKIIGAVTVAAVCTAATGGAAVALCVAGTLALVAEGIREGVDRLERGDINGAIESIGGTVLDAVDVLQMSAIPALLFRLGRRTLDSVEDAVGALGHWRAQGRAFAADGVVNNAFQRSRETLTSQPMRVHHAAGGGVVYQQGDAHFIRQGDHFVGVYDDGDGTLRLRDPSRSDAVGAPVKYKDGAWRRSDTAPSTRAPTTPHNRPGSPDWAKRLNAENLPATRYDELEALFGELTLNKPTADVHAVIDSELMNLRISDILADPQTLGLPGDEAMTIRAWADSALGSGKGVLTYTIDGHEWNQVARFGKGDVGLHVRVGSSRDLPTVEDLIAAADQDVVLHRLGLPADTDDATLLAAVREELVRTIRNNPKQSLESWQRWLTMRHRLPTAADNLIKHFRALTKAEAEELVGAATPQLKHQLESWDFPTEIRTAVSNVLANRAQRQQRQAIIEGSVHTLAEVTELSIHLNAVLPGRQVRALSVEGDRIELVFTSSVPGAPEATLSFTGRANVDSLPADGAGNEYATWQEGIFVQLTPAERESLPGRNGLTPTPADLRRAVVDKMRKSPIVAVCTWPRSPGSKFRKADDCAGESPDALAPAGVTSHDRAMRDALAKVMDTTHAKLTERHTYFSRELVEFNSLAKQEADLRQLKSAHGKGQRLDEPANEMDLVSKARLKDLQGRSFGDLDSFDIGNFASYELKHLTYDGQQLELPSGFPLVGTAMSGNSRPLLGTEGVLEGAPVRRILVPDTEANSILQLFEQYRGDYALGSDLSPVTGKFAEDGQASKLIFLKDEDLRVTKPSTKQGKKVKVPVSELTDEEISQLGNSDYAPNLRKLVGDAGLLPANVRTWKAGVGYRMYQIRSCSEGKFLDGFFRALGEALPALKPVLWGPRGATVERLTGNLHMVSEMNPCKRSCDRRLSEMLVMMPGMHIRVFYRFEDNLERVNWWTAQKVDVIVTKNRDAWEAARATWEQMQDMAAIELKKIEAAVRKGTRTWVDEALAQRPPSPPAPKLWEPQIEEAY
jgi:hypothetical protein